MKRSLRTGVSTVTAILVVMAGWVGSSGVASAAVVVPPGANGSACSEYHFVTPQHYWQTCAWADHQYVWFTVNFGNTGSSAWSPTQVWVDYIKSGVDKLCWKAVWYAPNNFVIPAHSVLGTPRMSCVISRVPGAYASSGYVQDGDWELEVHSPTLQVQ